FQAEDGIRDFHVTGVQTCALPIFVPTGVNAVAARIGRFGAARVLVPSHFMASRIPGTQVLENWTEDIAFLDRELRPEGPLRVGRSEERRVGKESRSQRWPENEHRI